MDLNFQPKAKLRLTTFLTLYSHVTPNARQSTNRRSLVEAVRSYIPFEWRKAVAFDPRASRVRAQLDNLTENTVLHTMSAYTNGTPTICPFRSIQEYRCIDLPLGCATRALKQDLRTALTSREYPIISMHEPVMLDSVHVPTVAVSSIAP